MLQKGGNRSLAFGSGAFFDGLRVDGCGPGKLD